MTNTDFRPLIAAQFKQIDRLHDEQRDSVDSIHADALIDAMDVLQGLVTAALDDGTGWTALNNRIYNVAMTDEDLHPDSVAPEVSAVVTEIL